MAIYECARSTGPAASTVGKCVTGCHMELVCLHAQPNSNDCGYSARVDRPARCRTTCTQTVTMALTPHQPYQRLEWCCARLSWSVSKWQRVIFSNECRFCLGGDDQQYCIRRHHGQHQDERFVVAHHMSRRPVVTPPPPLCVELCENIQAA